MADTREEMATLDLGKPIARTLREAHFYREIAARAVRLRQLGRLSEDVETELEELYEKRPDMTRSFTSRLMIEQAFKTAMDDFDKAVQDAALAGVTFDEIPKPIPA